MNKIVNKALRGSRGSRAFSLLELSIVIVIIGILIVGVVGSKHFIKKSRILAARTLTKSSPISGIKNNELWLETSINSYAFNDSNESLVSGDNIISWIDNSYNQSKPIVSEVGLGATFSNSIGGIHALQFDNSDSNYLEIQNPTFLEGTDYTIFVLEKRLGSGRNYFIGEEGSTDNQSLALGYDTDSTIIHSQGGDNSYSANIEGYAASSGSSRVFTFVSSSAESKKEIYINGVLSAQSTSNPNSLSNLSNIAIGKEYNGEIGEIVIFSRALKSSEREAIENYLGKKWKSSILRDQVNSGSCIGGISTSSGCLCSVNIGGVLDTQVSEGSGEFECTGSEYGSDTVDYSCSSGILSLTGENTSCSCSLGYFSSGGVCGQNCDIAGLYTGISETELYHGSTQDIICGSQYSGTVNVSCDDGNPTASGQCNLKCHGTIAGIGSYDLNTGTGNVFCDELGFDGNSVSYNCDNGDIDINNDSCLCGVGYVNGEARCDSCDVGYNDNEASGVCVEDTFCTFSGYEFVDDGTIVEVGSTQIGCKSGYTGNVNYTCNSSGSPVITSNECLLEQCSITNSTSSNQVETLTSNNMVVHIFKATRTYGFKCDIGRNAEILVVAAGGDGGIREASRNGAGGGAGGLAYSSSYYIGTNNYNITVGGPNINSSGNNSSISGVVTTYGGGRGASGWSSGPSSSGGSSGGKTRVYGNIQAETKGAIHDTSSNFQLFGSKGGGGSCSETGSSGGGGAGGVGGGCANIGYQVGPVGGSGKSYTIADTEGIISTEYAVGGGANTTTFIENRGNGGDGYNSNINASKGVVVIKYSIVP
ncbi:MAG: prepilin-type N-terminal cleavage/methylation domain-containing protein [Rickettsiales bacterium]|nr:prepilin-type N-terminal cleavage/methylation domain-containing protein [Rickettsiales bacterium]